MANEITEWRREGRRVRLLLLFPVTDPVPGVVPTPSEGLPENLPVDVPTVSERAALDAGTMAFWLTSITDRTDIPPDMTRRDDPDRVLADPDAEARKRAEEDALVADPQAVWDAGLRRHYAAMLESFEAEYEMNHRSGSLRRIDAGGR